jgi:hypothetical protein
MEPLIKFLKSRVGRITIAVGLLSCLGIVIFDSLDLEETKMMLVLNLGCAGTILSLGIGLLYFLPDDAPPRMRQAQYGLAILWIAGGGLIFLLLLYQFIHDIVVLMF